MRYQTCNCIVCGDKATTCHGYVLAKERMALGNYIPVKVLAGFCEKHIEALKSDESGCFGNYNPDIMGKCKPFRIIEVKMNDN